jgi:hypothetical protein
MRMTPIGSIVSPSGWFIIRASAAQSVAPIISQSMAIILPAAPERSRRRSGTNRASRKTR